MLPGSRLIFNNIKHSIVSTSSKLAYRKSQRSLLDLARQSDICSSIRPKVGKVFLDPVLENLKLEHLDECRKKLLEVSILEADNDINSLKVRYQELFTEGQLNLTKKQYLSVSKLAKSTESKILLSQKSKHENKLIYGHNNGNERLRTVLNAAHYHPERTIKHKDTILQKRRLRNRRRRLKNRDKRSRNLEAKIEAIKHKGSVVNLTNIDVPDCAILYLDKGSSFVPSVPVSHHDIIFDTNEFLRKIHWRTWFNTAIDNTGDDIAVGSNDVHPKLRLPSHKWPVVKNKLLDHVSNKISNVADSLAISRFSKYNNLTFLEKRGLFWCLKMKRDYKVHFSQADKGGAIVLMDPNVVNQVILSNLQNPTKYVLLPSDPRSDIESSLLDLCRRNLFLKGLNKSELFLITGNTEKGKSHNPLFSAGKPNPFPLFKLHSATPGDLLNKVTPPHRLVTSMKYGPTKRPALFLDSILTPVSITYCGCEYIKDTPAFLNKLSVNEPELCAPGVSLFTLDVKALYPSINLDKLPLAVESALDAVTDFTPERKSFLIELAKFSINNGVTHYRSNWFKSLLGISTGASDSVSLANIYMKWVLLQFFSKYPLYKRFIVSLVRFIDDLFGGWTGTNRNFANFINTFNSFGKEFGINFDKEQIGDTVNFLDVLVSNVTGVIVTDLYCKPTDAHRYLHRKSFHPKHTFSGIPFSQMRRAVVICSTNYLRDLAIDNIIEYFIDCGYEPNVLDKAKQRALQLDRKSLLVTNQTPPANNSTSKPLCFVLPYCVEVIQLKRIISTLLDDIEQLTGTREIIFSQKRNPNTSALLFNKYGFAQNNTLLLNQKCGSVNCDSCVLKFDNNSPISLLPNFVVNPSKTATCKTNHIIYTAICKLCMDFYFGKSINKEHIRMNGHRDKFTLEKHDKSALAIHIFTDHPDHVGNTPHEGLANYNVAILESVNPSNLRRRESFYIWATEAQLRHLNRYKVLH